MQAYVAQRRSPKHRIMTLDFEPGGFASLVLGHSSGDATVYELGIENGAVCLTVKYPGRDTKTLCTDPLPEEARHA